MENLVKKFAPIVYLHPNEQYFPCAIGNFLPYTEMINSDGTIVAKRGEINTENLVKFSQETKDPYLSVDKTFWPGQKDVENVPFYVRTVEHEEYIDISYIFLYAYNSGYFLGPIYLGGEHEADIEHLTVRVVKTEDPDTSRILKIYYSAHGSPEGVWINASDIEMENGHPVGYIAKGSHAMYPKQGTWYRIMGFANDKTVKGMRWQGEPVIINDVDWKNYQGCFGGPKPGNVSSLVRKTWWYKEEEHSCTFTERFFPCCF